MASVPEGPWQKASAIVAVVGVVLAAYFGFKSLKSSSGTASASSSSTAAPSASAPKPQGSSSSPANPAKTIFQDNFSGRQYGWVPVAFKGSGANYGNGVYRAYAASYSAVWSSPEKAYALYPSSPQNILVKVDARIAAAAPQAVPDTVYYVACRTSPTNTFNDQAGYAFEIAGTSVRINKITSYKPYVKSLKFVATTSAVHLHADNLLQGQCTNVEGGHGVHLVFSVNGQVVATATDTNNPLKTGSVSIGLTNAHSPGKPVYVEFDNFVARQVGGTPG